MIEHERDTDRERHIAKRIDMIPGDLTGRLQQIKDTSHAKMRQLIEHHPNWNEKKDARIQSLSSLTGLCEFSQFQIHILYRLTEKSWDWLEMQPIEYERNEWKNVIAQDFEMTIKYNFATSLFVYVESNFRFFLRALDPTACNGATSSFNKIYKKLFDLLDFSTNDKSDAKELLIFMGRTAIPVAS